MTSAPSTIESSPWFTPTRRATIWLVATIMVVVATACAASGPEVELSPVTTVEPEPATTNQGDNAGSVEPGTLIRVEIQPCAGLGMQRATAMAVGPDFALTAAHSFEAAKAATLRFSNEAGSEITVEARLIAADMDKDIAVVAPVVNLDEPWRAFSFGDPVAPQSVTVETYADADGPVTKQADLLRLVNATLDGEGRRAAAELGADIDPGDSGAPVLNPNGRVVAMVFATSRTSDRGWAVHASEMTTAIDNLVSNGDPAGRQTAARDFGFRCGDS